MFSASPSSVSPAIRFYNTQNDFSEYQRRGAGQIIPTIPQWARPRRFKTFANGTPAISRVATCLDHSEEGASTGSLLLVQCS